MQQPHQFCNKENAHPNFGQLPLLMALGRKGAGGQGGGHGMKQKKHHQIRAGDWVCLMCNNLNFSFRNVCNRCRVQTKKQNFIQNL